MSGFPARFWSEAIKTAEFLVNRYPSDLLDGDSPFFRWFGYALIYSIFHSFEVQCHVPIPQTKRLSAFSPVSSDAIFVGYSPANKAYRCYVPNLKTCIISNNVNFNDYVFPCVQSPDLLNEDSSGSFPSDIFGSSAPGAYLLSRTVSSGTSINCMSLSIISDETLSGVPHSSSPLNSESLFSAIDIPSLPKDSVAAAEHPTSIYASVASLPLDVDPPPAVHLEESFQTFIVPEGSPNFSNDISDNAEKDREVCIAPTDAAPQVANYFPSTSVMDNVPPEVLTVVPVIDPIPPTSSKSSLPSGHSDTHHIALLPEDTHAFRFF